MWKTYQSLSTRYKFLRETCEGPMGMAGVLSFLTTRGRVSKPLDANYCNFSISLKWLLASAFSGSWPMCWDAKV